MSARVGQLLAAVACAACVAAAVCRQGGAAAQQRVTGRDAVCGKARLVAFGCGNCHVIPGVSEPDARDIAAYVYTRTSDRLGPSHLIPVQLLPGH